MRVEFCSVWSRLFVFYASAVDVSVVDVHRRYVEVESDSIKKLYITKIIRQDEGNYTCTATIKNSQQRKTVSLRIFS